MSLEYVCMWESECKVLELTFVEGERWAGKYLGEAARAGCKLLACKTPDDE